MDNKMGNPPGGMSQSTNVSYKGATTISSDTSVSQETYSSTNGAENALLITGGKVSLDQVTVSKTGDENGDNSDFYGTNAAILVTDGAALNMFGGTVSTNGSHANGIFAYGSGEASLDSLTIRTSSNNSGGIMVTGGGKISATNLNVLTKGNSSAAIRSDRGGGTIEVHGGVFGTDGMGSPAVYSTADINIDNAVLLSTSSEGIVIEGKNSVSLDTTSLTATNHTLNGQSETYKTIFIYQSMSGDASEGAGEFTAKNSIITTNQGDHFFVTNTDAIINLSGNQFTQTDDSGIFLRAQSGAWGNSGSNGGHVTLNADSQEIIGDVYIDNISSLSMSMNHSYFKGAYSGDGEIKLSISSDSIVVLTGDSHISSLEDSDSNYSNIYANGHKLFVNGTEVSINESAAPESFLSFDETITGETIETTDETSINDSSFPVWGYFLIGGIIIAVIVAVLAVLLVLKKRKKPSTKIPNDSQESGQTDITDAF